MEGSLSCKKSLPLGDLQSKYQHKAENKGRGRKWRRNSYMNNMGKTRKRNKKNVQNVNNEMPKEKRRESRQKLGGCHAMLHPCGKLLSPEEPDVSSILKIPGSGQSDEPDELFDHPLHSTAVSAYEEVEKDNYSEPDGSTSNSSDSEPGKNTIGSKNQHALKLTVENEDSEELPMKENMRARESTPRVASSRPPSALPLRNSSSACRTSDRIKDLVKNMNTDKMPRTRSKSHVLQQEVSSPITEIDYPESDDGDPHSVKVWGHKGLKKVASHVTESDVILDEFEKITTKYKQGVELKICKKAINSFYIGFRDQLINTVADAEELKNTKLKNVKMVRATNKKRQRLLEVKEELIRTEPHLKKLKREYAELKERISCLKNAVRLVTDVNNLQQKYINNKRENPQEKVVYGISSLPALLIESRRIVGAENDFQNINSKLQQILDLHEEK
ncbi:centromere protein U isoform X2 [Hemicordylus capensis]|uniref:centromere protein U isoform X2 n=1 Tax=Hemicordylus capensis TaxID=884348 RepID=UPI002304444F|nr:centromere protein U isoform X2 [Hemicordylus capensis]